MRRSARRARERGESFIASSSSFLRTTDIDNSAFAPSSYQLIQLDA
jgi:hypothetical protein